MTQERTISVGCDSLDALLDGGLEPGTVTQLYGPPGSGKTNISLSASVTTATRGGRVLYIDSEGLSPDRLEQLIGSADGSSSISDRIVIRDVLDFQEQRTAIKEAQSVSEAVDLIVVDSLTGFYRLERGDETDEGAALRSVTRQLTHLLSIARKQTLAVLVTNQVFTDPESGRARPLGGHTLSHWMGTTIRLERFRGGNRRATLEKHRSVGAGDTAGFRITDDGLEAVDQLA